MNPRTGNFIISNKISVEKYLLDEHIEVYLKTKTLSAVSACIDFIYGLILLPKRKNMSKMATYCCKCSNNQSLSHFISNYTWPSADLLKSVRTKAIEIIGKDGVLILDESGIKKIGKIFCWSVPSVLLQLR